ncbi:MULTISPECIES: CsbD family protein [Streptomyces]|uniref:CsbD family protein n=1 Tax=Streptomyces marianii TaxID=1817406 RepID=A0A5R9EDL1_9ACTN|nr:MULTISPECIES: CsbD family protein [Streptomyces]MCZ7460440.1 CsbD family protein [Streptomyces sp. WMMC940]MDI9885830.1 CsbD family protein [Streptomyces sp. HNM0645]TLQ46134.1 CsbD family protein [Streptomyces marianii]
MSKHNAKARQIKGKLKETLGKTMGDKSMQRSGRSDMLRGKAQEMAEKAADQVRRHTRHH